MGFSKDRCWTGKGGRRIAIRCHGDVQRHCFVAIQATNVSALRAGRQHKPTVRLVRSGEAIAVSESTPDDFS